MQKLSDHKLNNNERKITHPDQTKSDLSTIN